MTSSYNLRSTVNWREFSLICLFVVALSWLSQYLLISDNLYFNTFADQLSYERIEVLIEKGKDWQWLGYLIIPVLYLTKLFLIAICLSLGYLFTQNRFKLNVFFNIAIFAELIFLLSIVIKIVWFLFIQTNYTLNDLTQFYPLSALNLVDANAVPRYWLAPLQTLNLFEVAYWFLLAYGVADATGFSFKRSFGLVMSSYGVGLVLWIVLVMFLTITSS